MFLVGCFETGGGDVPYVTVAKIESDTMHFVLFVISVESCSS
jgi:hypothetical protein